MKMITVNNNVIENELKYDGQTLLTYRIEYPQLEAQVWQLSIVLINRIYRLKAQEYKRYYEDELFSMAVRQYEEDLQNGYPVRVFEGLILYNIKYNEECIVSLYFDKYEYTGGAHGNTVRFSQTWNVQKFENLRLERLVKCTEDFKAYIVDYVIGEIKKGPELYFEDYERLAYETFNEDSFYATPGGIVVYYQQYDIAPYASGIREFLIPYSHCVINPVTTCFK